MIFLSIKKINGAEKLTFIKEGDERSSPNNIYSIWNVPLETNDALRSPSSTEQDEKQSTPLFKVDCCKQTKAGTIEDWILTQYSTSKEEIPPEQIDDDQIPSQSSNAKSLLPPGGQTMNKLHHVMKTSKTEYR